MRDGTRAVCLPHLEQTMILGTCLLLYIFELTQSIDQHVSDYRKQEESHTYLSDTDI